MGRGWVVPWVASRFIHATPKFLASPDRTGMMPANAAGLYNHKFLPLIN